MATPRHRRLARSSTAQTSPRQLRSQRGRPITVTRRFSDAALDEVGMPDAGVVAGGEAQVGGEAGEVGHEADHGGRRPLGAGGGEALGAAPDHGDGRVTGLAAVAVEQRPESLLHLLLVTRRAPWPRRSQARLMDEAPLAQAVSERQLDGADAAGAPSETATRGGRPRVNDRRRRGFLPASVSIVDMLSGARP